jgi:hypothetical protein
VPKWTPVMILFRKDWDIHRAAEIALVMAIVTLSLLSLLVLGVSVMR